MILDDEDALEDAAISHSICCSLWRISVSSQDGVVESLGVRSGTRAAAVLKALRSLLLRRRLLSFFYAPPQSYRASEQISRNMLQILQLFFIIITAGLVDQLQNTHYIALPTTEELSARVWFTMITVKLCLRYRSRKKLCCKPMLINTLSMSGNFVNNSTNPRF